MTASPVLRLLTAAALACGAIAGVGLVDGHSSEAATSRTIHVAPDGSDAASGDAGDPVRTVARGVQLATDGDVVLVGEGTYHEQVQVYGKDVSIVGAGDDPRDVVFDGARAISGWSASGGRWSVPWTAEFPHTQNLSEVDPDYPSPDWADRFYVDGVRLREVGSVSEVTTGTFFHDRPGDRLWIGDDPANRVVEGSDLAWGLYLNRAHGSSVSNLTVRRYATPSADMAAVRVYSDDATATDLIVEDNAFMGFSVIGQRVTATGIEARRNGHLGMHAHRSVELRIEGSTVVENNVDMWDAWHSAGGLKITETDILLIADSVFDRNNGPGLWLDLDVTHAALVSNRTRDNMRSGIEIEISSSVIAVDNESTGNGETGIWVLESSDVDVWHNALFGNEREVWVEDGPRRDLVGVRVFNNVLGGPGPQPVFAVDDWTGERSADDMQVAAGSNRFWLDGSRLLSRWARWPYPLGYASTIDEHRSVTGQGVDSDATVSATNPYVRSADDLRQPDGAPLGAVVPPHVAAAAGIDEEAHPAGLLGVGGPGIDPTTTTTTTTTTVVDVRNPYAPKNPRVEVDGMTVRFSWDPASDDVGIAEYIVYRNNEVIATTSATSIVLDDLGVGDHWLQVRAVDTAGKESVKTAPIHVQLSAPDVSTTTLPPSTTTTTVAPTSTTTTSTTTTSTTSSTVAPTSSSTSSTTSTVAPTTVAPTTSSTSTTTSTSATTTTSSVPPTTAPPTTVTPSTSTTSTTSPSTTTTTTVPERPGRRPDGVAGAGRVEGGRPAVRDESRPIASRNSWWAALLAELLGS